MPIFPRLESITAHPMYILWFLDSAVASPASQGDTALGDLKSVVITSEHSQGDKQFNDYAWFDKALKSVVMFCRWRNDQTDRRNFKRFILKGQGQPAERTIDLTLRFRFQGDVNQWFASHLSTSLEPSVLTQLTHISILTISIADPVKISQETVNSLPAWLALISNASIINTPGSRTTSILQKVKFIDHPADIFPAGEAAFVRRVAEKCVGLMLIQMHWDANLAVDLDKIRGNNGTRSEPESERVDERADNRLLQQLKRQIFRRAGT